MHAREFHADDDGNAGEKYEHRPWEASFTAAAHAWNRAESASAEYKAATAKGQGNPDYPQATMQIPERKMVLDQWSSALNWIGREDEAHVVHEKGVAEGM